MERWQLEHISINCPQAKAIPNFQWPAHCPHSSCIHVHACTCTLKRSQSLGRGLSYAQYSEQWIAAYELPTHSYTVVHIIVDDSGDFFSSFTLYIIICICFMWLLTLHKVTTITTVCLWQLLWRKVRKSPPAVLNIYVHCYDSVYKINVH